MVGTSMLKRLNWREPGLYVSVFAHVSVLALSLFAFTSAKPFDPATESVPVDVITEKDFNELTKGEKTAKVKLPEPQRRVDKVADIKQDNDPGQAKKDVPTPPAKVEAAKAEPKPEPKPEPPPKPEPRPEPEQKVAIAPPPPVRPPDLRVKTPTPPTPEEDEEEDKDAEIIKQKPPKRPEAKKEEPKPEPKPEPKVDPLAKLLDEKKREADKAAADAKAAAEAKAAADAKAADEKKRALEKKAAEEKKIEADKKAKEAREKQEREAAETKKLTDAIRQRLLSSKEAPSSSGSTGAVPTKQASLGAENATGKRLSPSERSQLIGVLTEQMNRCLSIPPGAIPKSRPEVRLTLGRDGAITSGPSLTNPKSEPGYMPYAEANMRALRACQPFRIPARFLETYEDWKNLVIGFDPSEM